MFHGCFTIPCYLLLRLTHSNKMSDKLVCDTVKLKMLGFFIGSENGKFLIVVLLMCNYAYCLTYNSFSFYINSLCQSLYASVGEALDAYEAALGAVMQQETVQSIWLE